MSATISLTSAKAYGVERVCAIWAQPRSSFYAWRRNRSTGSAEPATPAQKRGPKSVWSDPELLSKIRADLARSPFQGEGHRKVWARLRVLQGVRTSRKRVLRLMREANLLAPCRRPQGQVKLHEGTITTEEPGVMWGTDGVRILTADEGWVWAFFCVEHWNA